VKVEDLLKALKSQGIEATQEQVVGPGEIKKLMLMDDQVRALDAARMIGLARLQRQDFSVADVAVIVAKENEKLWEALSPLVYGLMSATGQLTLKANVLFAAQALLLPEDAKILKEAVKGSVVGRGSKTEFIIDLIQESDPNLDDIQIMHAEAQKAA
jgi:hypothetical protein